MNHFGHFHIEATVLGDVHDATLLPPFDRIGSHGSLTFAESLAGDRVEFRAMLQLALEVEHQIEVPGLFLEVQDGVSHEHFVVKRDVVESDDQVGRAELVDEFLHVSLVIDPVPIFGCTEGHADGHPHIRFAIPTANIICGAHRLQVKIYEIFRHIWNESDVGFVHVPRKIRKNRVGLFDFFEELRVTPLKGDIPDFIKMLKMLPRPLFGIFSGGFILH